MVCDWRDLNRITINNKARLPNVDDVFDAVQGTAYFSKLDLDSGFNQKSESGLYSKLQLTPLWAYSIQSHGILAYECPSHFPINDEQYSQAIHNNTPLGIFNSKSRDFGIRMPQPFANQ